MLRNILCAASAGAAVLACGTLATAQTGPAQTTLQGEILGISGHTIKLKSDAGPLVTIDDRQAVAGHRGYGVSAYNHVIVTGAYGPRGRFIATAIRSYESREFAFRAHITAVNGNRISMVREDNGAPFVVDDSPAIAAHRAFGLRPGSHVLVEGKYGSDNIFRANRIAYIR